MRPPQKNRNNRNKNGRNNKPVGNIQNRVFESAGPEGKVRGTPQQIIEKYLILARDAQTSGDRVVAENFLQHAEHYIRMLSASQPQGDDRRPAHIQNGRGDFGDPADGDDEDDADSLQTDAATHSDRRGNSSRPTDPDAREDGAHRGEHRSGVTEGGPRDRDERHGDGRAVEGNRPRRERAADKPERADPPASGLEMIETNEDLDGGLVATPESKSEDEPPKKAEPRRRRRRAAPAEAEGDAPTAKIDATESVATAPEEQPS